MLLDADGVVIRLVRSAVPYPDIPSVTRSFEAVIATLEIVGRRGRVMLFDARAPVGRNDPEFEKRLDSSGRTVRCQICNNMPAGSTYRSNLLVTG